MLRIMDGMAATDLYERDFYAWTQDQAARVRALGARNDGLDVENVAEEIESLGKSDRRAAGKLTARIIEHLLKLRWHPSDRDRPHWRAEVREFRAQLDDILADSRSLRAQRDAIAAPHWKRVARSFLDRLEADGHDPAPARLALRSPDRPYFDLDAEVLNEDWFPPSGG